MGAGVAALALGGCSGSVVTRPDAELLKIPATGQPGHVVLARHAREVATRQICEEVIPRVSDLAWLERGDRVFIKVACNSPYEHPAVTSPAAVRGLVGFLRDHGAGEVLVGDQSGVEHVRRTSGGRVSSTKAAMTRNGLAQAVQDSGARLYCFDDQPWEAFFQPALPFADHWEGQLWLPNVLRQVDHVIYLTRLSNHALAGYTAGVKVSVGWMRDDSRLHLHQRAGSFFEQFAEANLAPELRQRLRLVLSMGDRALLNIGPDFGSKYDLGGTVTLASSELVDHDLLAAATLAWLDTDDTSFFDIYAPYPKRADYHNRKFVEEYWGEAALARYTRLVPNRLAPGLAADRCLARVALLQGRRPSHVRIERLGAGLPEGLVRHLAAFDGGVLQLGA